MKRSTADDVTSELASVRAECERLKAMLASYESDPDHPSDAYRLAREAEAERDLALERLDDARANLTACRTELDEATERESWAACQLAPILGVFEGTPFDPDSDVLVWQTFVDYAARLAAELRTTKGLLAAFEADPDHPEPPIVKGALDAQEDAERRCASLRMECENAYRLTREAETERDEARAERDAELEVRNAIARANARLESERDEAKARLAQKTDSHDKDGKALVAALEDAAELREALALANKDAGDACYLLQAVPIDTTPEIWAKWTARGTLVVERCRARVGPTRRGEDRERLLRRAYMMMKVADALGEGEFAAIDLSAPTVLEWIEDYEASETPELRASLDQHNPHCGHMANVEVCDACELRKVLAEWGEWIAKNSDSGLGVPTKAAAVAMECAAEAKR